ncbi:ABC transporter permease [uncultured Bifidobacterium sp.]|uniref:FtsX-like permease family protein n=1 Tax=uncultured Bifidobacterium sp. TaxID=165187 RepID=UPI00260E00D4|nr:ABC transporter permease [uncultured Bifidobacterium sp.]
MFIVKNALRSVSRSKGRNILIVIIVAIIAAAATIGLSIRQAAQTARETGLSDTTITAQIDLNRSKLISQQRSSASASSSSSSSSTPDFKSLRKSLSNKQLSLATYKKYAKASSAVANTYYTLTASVSKTTSFQPVETTSSSSSSSSNLQSNQQAPGGQSGGQGMMEEQTESGDFELVGFSSDTAVANASNGSFTMSSGKVFGYDSDSDGDVIVSKSLAEFNDIRVGDTIKVTDSSDSSTTHKLTVVGIYKNSSDSSSTSGPNSSTSSDPANAIYTSVSTLKKLGLDTTSGDDATAQLSFTYVFSSKDDYETFVKDVKKAGLSSSYTVSSTDVDEYESSLVPLNNLSSFALTLLLVVLAVGAVVLVALNLFTVRERKYEVGVLTAIGVKKAKVAIQFVLELLIVTMIGLAIGAVAGAVTSVPVSNKLLASQVSSQQSEQTSQTQQFGREMQGGAGGQQNGSSNSSSTQSSSSSSSSSSTTTSGGSTSQPQSSNSNSPGGAFKTNTTKYLSSINASVNLTVVGQLMLIGLGLTIVSSLVAVVFVMRYEPLQILAERS